MTAPSIPEAHTGPGLVDLQLNGYAGVDFNAPPDRWTVAQLQHVRSALRRRGVVMALPTLITDDPERLVARAAAYARIVEDEPELAAAFPGLHVEGPFISPADGPRGAHPRAHCHTPAGLPDLVDRLREASGDRIRIVTLAPELPGALDLISALAGAGICAALGHTEATPEVIEEAVSAGARMSTHLGNGSHQLLPRHANYIQAQLAQDGLMASFIADGHHLPWYALQNFIRAKTPERAVLVTDAIAGADAPPGRYPLGDEEVEVSPAGRVHKPGQPNLAGSALTLDRAVIDTARRCGVPFPEAWAMASLRPATVVALDGPEEVTVRVTESGFRREG